MERRSRTKVLAMVLLLTVFVGTVSAYVAYWQKALPLLVTSKGYKAELVYPSAHGIVDPILAIEWSKNANGEAVVCLIITDMIDMDVGQLTVRNSSDIPNGVTLMINQVVEVKVNPSDYSFPSMVSLLSSPVALGTPVSFNKADVIWNQGSIRAGIAIHIGISTTAYGLNNTVQMQVSLGE